MSQPSTLPEWVYELVNAVEEHEEIHPKGYTHPGTTNEVSTCLYWVLTKIPDSVRGYAAGFKAGYADAIKKHTEEQS